MPYGNFTRKRRPVQRKRRTATKGKTAKLRKPVANAVKSIVNRTIHRNMENKIEQTLSANNTVSSYASNSSLFVVSCIPYTAISQGVGQGDRIGNTIRTRKVMFNYVLKPSPYSASLNPTPIPQEVFIFFGKVKNAKPQAPISTDFAKLWQAGDSYHAPYSNLLDCIQDVNKDWFTVYKILRHKIGYAITSTAGMAPSNEYYANNDFKFNVARKVNITKFTPKVVKFNDTTAQPTNDGLWMWAMCVNADGSGTVNASPIQMDYTLNYEYEDA